MRRYRTGLPGLLWSGVFLSLMGTAAAAELTPAERGREALLGRAFSPAIGSRNAYESLWKQWGLKEKPADYAKAVMERYGLHPAPYDNHGLPMGLREVPGIFSKGVTADCMLCHAGSIAGHSYVGLPNSSVDLMAFFQDLAVADGLPEKPPYRFSNVRGTIEATASTVFLMSFREPDLSLRVPDGSLVIDDQLCEDTPAWWLMKKKKTLYHGGSADNRSMRTLMAFMLSPLNSGDYIKKQEPVFRDIKEHLLTLEPPKYPLPVDEKRAARGKELFASNCAKCHGTYGADGAYPNKIVDLDTIGTDRSLAENNNRKEAGRFVESWFGQEPGPDGKPFPIVDHHGYQAPPLDGVWATAPYFHNGSVPTLYYVLNSKARPKIFTRSYRTGVEDYDAVKAGWKITVLERGADPKRSPYEQRKIYDTTLPGRGNGGHTFGDKFSDEERMDVIEYLKTL
jgi:hypothetical protein